MKRSDHQARYKASLRNQEIRDVLDGEKPGMYERSSVGGWWITLTTLAVILALCLWGPEIAVWVCGLWDKG